MQKLFKTLIFMLVASCGVSQSNEDKVQALMDAFATGDPDALQYISDDKYIQHNLGVPDGKEGIAGWFNGSPLVSTQVFRIFSDGDYVIVNTLYGGNVVIDVFRFESGLMVEHWDNISSFINDNDGTTPINGTETPVSDLDKTEENRSLIQNMCNDLFLEGKWELSTNYLDTNNFIEHNHGYTPDKPAFMEIAASLANDESFYKAIKFIHVQGNFALVMSEGSDLLGDDDQSRYAYYDLLRIENNLVREHWGITQKIPEVQSWQNQNGKWGDDAISGIFDQNNSSNLKANAYPVPSNDILYIEVPTRVMGAFKVQIRDASGQLLVDAPGNDAGGKLLVDISQLKNGNYNYLLFNDNYNVSGTFNVVR